jgi:biotin carboxyl carrier protein
MKPGRFLVRSGEDLYPVEVAPDGRVVVNGAADAWQIVETGPGRYHVSNGAGSWEVFVQGAAGARQVFVNGEVYELEVLSEGATRNAPPVRHIEPMAAPMPATVVRVLAAVGQTVGRGEPLVKLEAMKMELPIRAPRDGRVRAVHCREGEIVQPGVRLVELE